MLGSLQVVPAHTGPRTVALPQGQGSMGSPVLTAGAVRVPRAAGREGETR